MDTIEKANEIVYMLWSVISGVTMIALYDFLRARRREKKILGIFVYLEDIIWFAILGIVVYVLAFRENAGVIRWYSIFAMAVGATLYKLLFGDLIMELFRKIT